MDNNYDVKYMKLVTGEEIISGANFNGGIWTLRNPVRIQLVSDPSNPQRMGAAFLPFSIFMKDLTIGTYTFISIKDAHVIYVTEPAPTTKDQYNKQFGSPILQPEPGIFSKPGLKLVA